MALQIITTGDGSHSLFHTGSALTYHSRFGALAESEHVFIQAGLKEIMKTKREISVFEMGFGTGLNALLTLVESTKADLIINYETTDTQQLEEQIIQQLNYPLLLQNPSLTGVLHKMHLSPWEEQVEINGQFHLFKHNRDIRMISFRSVYDLVYYDAFDPMAQPELWTFDIFKRIFSRMNRVGILVTYSSKGVVRRALQDAGFRVEKLPGPEGKREIVRAWA